LSVGGVAGGGALGVGAGDAFGAVAGGGAFFGASALPDVAGGGAGAGSLGAGA
jgi:hypothetical protein